jgi:hypothetical protein
MVYVYNQALAGGVMRLLFITTILCSMLILHQVYAAEQIITGEDTALFDQTLSLPNTIFNLRLACNQVYLTPSANPLSLPGYLISHVPPVRAPPRT